MKNLFTTNLGVAGTALAIIASLSQPASAGVLIESATGNIDLGQYTSVGKLTADGLVGSGVKISDNWVLTAAHHVGGKTNISFDIGGERYTADSVITYGGDWDDSDLFEGIDIALVGFNENNKIDSSVADAKLWTSDSMNKVGTNVGFGATGTGNVGYINGTEGIQKNAGQNMIDLTGSDIMGSWSDNILVQDFDSGDVIHDYLLSQSTSNPLGLEYLIAPGDSGGGLFVEYENETYLAGIHSFVSSYMDPDDPRSIYGDIAGSTSVAAYKDWIYDTTGMQQPVPEPASFALLGLGLAGIIFVKRKKA